MFVVIGATGKVGGATIRELRAEQRPVRAVVRDRAKAAELERLGCEVVVADVADSAALSAAFAGAEAVQVICPIQLHAADALSEMKIVVEALADALDRARAPAVLVVSDYGAHVAADTGITRLFHHFETRFMRLDTRLTFLRSAEQMENWARYLGLAAKVGVLPSMHHPLSKPFPTVAARDVGVLAAELLLSARSSQAARVVHIEGPRRYSALSVAAILAEGLRRDVKALELPRAEWLAALARAGIGESYANLVAALFDAHNAGMIDIEPDVGEVRRGKTELAQVVQSFAERW